MVEVGLLMKYRVEFWTELNYKWRACWFNDSDSHETEDLSEANALFNYKVNRWDGEWRIVDNYGRILRKYRPNYEPANVQWKEEGF